ncbi:MAG: response regulator [Acidobacteriia bacterium]|nr:response regulator [Terriglobia bacterium]
MMYPKAEWPGTTVLVVEDTDAIRRMVCAMLTQNGYNCLEASDGAEALRLLEAVEDVHLVLTDLIMPNMDGAELARHLSDSRPELRIIFMSGYAEDVGAHLLDRTTCFFLSKPFTPMALMKEVRAALDQPWQGIPDVRAGLRSA